MIIKKRLRKKNINILQYYKNNMKLVVNFLSFLLMKGSIRNRVSRHKKLKEKKK